MEFQEQAEGAAVGEVGDHGDEGRLGAVVEAEQSPGGSSTAVVDGPARSEAMRGCTPAMTGTSTLRATAACSRPSRPPSHQVARSHRAKAAA